MMSHKNLKPVSYGHVSSSSMDTNASAKAESAISMGLSMFPEPPSSTPSTPLRSEFGGIPSPIRTTFSVPSKFPPRQDAGHSSPSRFRTDSRSGSFKTNLTVFNAPNTKDSIPGSSQAPSAYHSGATSSIDVDTVESFPPSSFINALLQTNKAQRRVKDDAMSGISEMTYPSLLDKLETDSETLHSNQGHTPIIRTASVSRRALVQGPSVVGVAPAMLRNVSVTKQYSSSVNAGDPLNTHKSLPSSTYKGGYDLSDDSKTFDCYRFPTTGTPGALPHSGPAELHIKDTIMDPGPTSLLSRITGLSLLWKKDKPLPPVPGFAHTLVLPDLAKGQHPHQSVGSYNVPSEPPSAPRSVQRSGRVKSETVPNAPASHLSPHVTTTFASASRKKKRISFLICFFLVVALAAIGAGVGVSVSSRNKHRLPACTGNFTGAACNLDATCVCTSSVECNGLAKAIVDLTPIINQNFATNISLTSVYNSLWILQGSPTTSNCASQALLADIGNGIDENLYPNRTQWAQTALLWNAIQTQDVNAAGQLQKFVQKILWTSLGTTDGPVSNYERGFSTTVAGFTFNFASQTVTQPSASFVTLGQPTDAQISRVSSQAQTTLDRMYAFAQASSIQHHTALTTYWTSVLLQRPQDLAIFKAALSVSPVLLPFDASSPSIQTLYSNSTSSLFPPPLACFPNLTIEVQQQINLVETSVFGLQPTANTTSEFDISCYQGRPVYGVLDVLRLRLPFLDSQSGAVKQAVVLTRDAKPRVVLYNGLMFSTAPSVTSITSPLLDARQYGTLGLFDHVVLQYLTSIPNVSTASALVSYILGVATNTSIPPDESSPLFQSLQSIPYLEVAVFGDVGPPDLTSTAASFTTSDGSLFFGSNDGADLRNWTINTLGGPVVWTENATSPLVVRDTSLGNTTISQTWNAISMAISNNIPDIGLANITTTLQGTQNFSP